MDIQDSQLVNKIIENHAVGADDLNSAGELDNIVREAHSVYKTDAESAEVRKLSKIKYRTHLRRDITKFADQIKQNY
jgi:type I restriction enzyme R subunit